MFTIFSAALEKPHHVRHHGEYTFSFVDLLVRCLWLIPNSISPNNRKFSFFLFVFFLSMWLRWNIIPLSWKCRWGYQESALERKDQKVWCHITRKLINKISNGLTMIKAHLTTTVLDLYFNKLVVSFFFKLQQKYSIIALLHSAGTSVISQIFQQEVGLSHVHFWKSVNIRAILRYTGKFQHS